MSVIKSLVALIAATVFVGAANAGPITITNASFETGAPSAAGIVPSWTVTASSGNPQEVLMSAYTPKPVGTGAAFLWTYVGSGTLDTAHNTVSQTLTGNTLAADTTYTLSVWVGHESAPTAYAFANTTLTLSAGATPLASTYIGQTSWQPTALAEPGAGLGQYYTVVYTTGASPIAGDLGITLKINGAGYAGLQVGLFDNVTLDASAIPEPGTTALLGMGLCGLLLVVRRRRHIFAASRRS